MTINNQKLIDSTQFLLAVCYREIADDNWIRRTSLGHNHFAEAVKILYNLRRNNSQQQLFQFELMKTLAKINVFATDKMPMETMNEAIERPRLVKRISPDNHL